MWLIPLGLSGFSRIPLHREALRDGDSGLWFVKADSDFVVSMPVAGLDAMISVAFGWRK